MHKSFYRPDIDGLRAIAIIAVVLFHAKLFGFSGGFVGVDIFFVISGFLITSILQRELELGTFSFLQFWARRIRRIFPALITVILATFVVANLFLLFPQDFLNFGRSLLLQSLFLSNLFFLQQQGYFAGPAETSPLLHTWTLSVEEQFYIILPFLLYYVRKIFKKRVPLVLCLIGIVSFAVNIYLVHFAPGNNFAVPFIPNIWGGAINSTAAFFLLPSRIWEFMIGALITQLPTVINISKRVIEILSVVGVLAIGYAVTQFNSGTLFPGVNALLPVLGAAAIIIAGTYRVTFVSKVLSLPAFVWVGLISYPLYLWHWPTLVFARIIFGSLSTIQLILLVAISVGMAWLTYKYIEAPFREKRFLSGSVQILVAGFCCLLVMGMSGYMIRFSDVSSRVPDYAIDFSGLALKQGPRYIECNRTKTSTTILRDGPCLLGSENSEVSFVLWGDSHAGAILDTVDTLAKQNHVRGAAFNSGDCIPIIGVSRFPVRDECQAIKQQALSYIQKHDIKHVFLVARWNSYVGEGSTGPIIDIYSPGVSMADSERVFTDRFDDMLRTWTEDGRAITILKQVPEFSHFNQRDAFYQSVRDKIAVPISNQPFHDHEKYAAFTDKIFSQFAQRYNVSIIDPAETFCTIVSGCRFYTDTTILYEDDNHLNFTGANLLAPQLQSFFDSVSIESSSSPKLIKSV